MSNTNNVVVLVCLFDGNFNVELLELAIASLRKKALYKGDIVVFTDFTRKLRNEENMSVTRVHVTRLPSEDPRNFRIYMDEYYDFSKHKKLIYLDFDILALKNINRMFSSIKEDAIYFTYAPVFPWDSSAFMAGGYVEQYRDSNVVKNSVTGICSGIFGIKTSLLPELLSIWKNVLANTPTNNDQHALNEAIIKNMIEGIAYPNEWVAYPAQVRNRIDDRRAFNGKIDPMLYHFNPVDNQTKYQMMLEYMK